MFSVAPRILQALFIAPHGDGLQRMLRQIALSGDVTVHRFSHLGLCRSLLLKLSNNKVWLLLFPNESVPMTF